MQQALTQETSRQPGSATEQVVRKWLVVFGSLFQREITPLLIGAWCELLGDLEPGVVERACNQAAKTTRFFPSVGDIRGQIDQAEAKGFELEAETEWQHLLDWIGENYFPDTGIKRGAPQLPAATLHAARAAGGFAYIERCPQDELVWCRKNFLSAYKNVHETGLAENLLGDGEAKRILSKLCAGPPALPSGNHDWEKKYETAPAPAVLRPAIVKELAKPFRTLTEEEWEQRKRDLKQRAMEWAAEHCLTVEAAHPRVEEPVLSR